MCAPVDGLVAPVCRASTLTTASATPTPPGRCPRSSPVRGRSTRSTRQPGQHRRCRARRGPAWYRPAHATPPADRGRVAPGPRGPHCGSTASPNDDAAIAGRFTANDLLPFPARHLVKLSCAAGCTAPAAPSRTARHPAASSTGGTREEDRNDQQRQRADLGSGAVAPAGASGSSASAWARRSWRRPGRDERRRAGSASAVAWGSVPGIRVVRRTQPQGSNPS